MFYVKTWKAKKGTETIRRQTQIKCCRSSLKTIVFGNTLRIDQNCFSVCYDNKRSMIRLDGFWIFARYILLFCFPGSVSQWCLRGTVFLYTDLIAVPDKNIQNFIRKILEKKRYRSIFTRKIDRYYDSPSQRCLKTDIFQQIRWEPTKLIFRFAMTQVEYSRKCRIPSFSFFSDFFVVFLCLHTFLVFFWKNLSFSLEKKFFASYIPDENS